MDAQRSNDHDHALDELIEQLAEQRRTIERLEKNSRLHEALYAIADLANSELDMDEMLCKVHAIVDTLTYAKNLYIALYNAERATRRYMYYADENEYPRIDTSEEVPAAKIGNSLTMAVIRHARPAMGPSSQLLDEFGLKPDPELGPPSLDWLGVPMMSEGVVHGAVIVQSYDQPNRYTEEDRVLLTFVAQHILSAMQHKQSRAELEQQVKARTTELAETVHQLRKEISDRVRAERQLAYETLHDTLTGLPNRIYFHEALERALVRFQRDPHYRFAVLFLDLDRFKVINDSIGHLVGDQILKEAGHRLTQHARSPDLVARIGGDEFALLLETAPTPEEACHVAEKVIESLNAPVRIEGNELSASASVGIVFGHAHYQNADEVLRDAEVAMYRAKSHGGRQFELFDENLHHQALQLLTLESALRRAIQYSEFEPYFQPIVHLGQRRIVGYEALLRWHHPQHGLLAPDAFLAVAEENGSIEQIDWIMFEKVCQRIPLLGDDDAYVTINIAPRHFRSPTLASKLLQLLQTHQLPAHRLRIELTEGALIDNSEQVLTTLEELREAGVVAVLDDFGTGYSSLSYLNRFPLHSIKIDRSFVSSLQLETDNSSTAIVRAVLALAQALGLDVVAEGIETKEQRDFLRAIGCGFGQGFLFSHARPAQEWSAEARCLV